MTSAGIEVGSVESDKIANTQFLCQGEAQRKRGWRILLPFVAALLGAVWIYNTRWSNGVACLRY